MINNHDSSNIPPEHPTKPPTIPEAEQKKENNILKKISEDLIPVIGEFLQNNDIKKVISASHHCNQDFKKSYQLELNHLNELFSELLPSLKFDKQIDKQIKEYFNEKIKERKRNFIEKAIDSFKSIDTLILEIEILKNTIAALLPLLDLDKNEFRKKCTKKESFDQVCEYQKRYIEKMNQFNEAYRSAENSNSLHNSLKPIYDDLMQNDDFFNVLDSLLKAPPGLMQGSSIYFIAKTYPDKVKALAKKCDQMIAISESAHVIDQLKEIKNKMVLLDKAFRAEEKLSSLLVEKKWEEAFNFIDKQFQTNSPLIEGMINYPYEAVVACCQAGEVEFALRFAKFLGTLEDKSNDYGDDVAGPDLPDYDPDLLEDPKNNDQIQVLTILSDLVLDGKINDSKGKENAKEIIETISNPADKKIAEKMFKDLLKETL